MKYIKEYINFVHSGTIAQCKEQFLFCDMVERTVINSSDIYIDEDLAEKYLSLQKYFPFDLFAWEKCLLVLFLCTFYKSNKLPRFTELYIQIGRGSGKNGFLSFICFCLLSPYNPIQQYDIDLFANSEDQAKTSFEEVYNVLSGDNAPKLKKFFKWTKTVITGLKNQSKLRFWTANPGTKDGFRPGIVIFDERHQYENSSLIDVAEGGLGKVPHPRILCITTDGFVRGSVMDEDKQNNLDILNQNIEDNDTLPFICKIDCLEDVMDEKNWYKANPSLLWNEGLLVEIRREFVKYKQNPNEHPAFPTKRLNFPVQNSDAVVTSWENILATNQNVEIERGLNCIVGIDYASTTDFVGVGLLFYINGKYVWDTHSFVCKQSKDLSRIKAPLQAWEQDKLLTFIDDKEINPEVVVNWFLNRANELKANILKICLDKFRYTLLSKYIKEAGFSDDLIKLVRPSDEMMIIPVIESAFINHSIVFGENPLMRWYTNNSKIMPSGVNRVYGKIEPKSRKTDGFKAFATAMTQCELINQDNSGTFTDIPVFVF